MVDKLVLAIGTTSVPDSATSTGNGNAIDLYVMYTQFRLLSSSKKVSEEFYGFFDGSAKDATAGSAAFLLSREYETQLANQPPAMQNNHSAEAYAFRLILEAVTPTTPLTIVGDNEQVVIIC